MASKENFSNTSMFQEWIANCGFKIKHLTELC